MSENNESKPDRVTMPDNIATNPYKLELDFIKKSVESSKVVMFSATYCRWCKVAAGYFKQFDINVNKIEIDKKIVHDNKVFTEEQGRNMFGILAQATDQQATVPKVFICGKYLGGCDAVQETFENGNLERILEQCKKDGRFPWNPKT